MPTSILEELITEQLAAQNAMSRAFANLKKKGAPTLGTIEARQQNLLAKWQSIQTRHKEILSLKTNENRSVNYFTENFIESAEETYLDEYAKFVDATHAILNKTSKPVPTATSSDTPDTVRKFTRKLPPVQLPTFSGKYADWKSYKDLFQAMLADFADLSDVERLYYLKSTLRDDAAKTIKNIPVTEENYKRAWDRLVEHYDNTRALVHSAVSALFQIPTLTKETASGLRQLRDAYNEAIETLEALDRPVKHWDDILVFIITQRLDSRTSRDWQTTRGDTMEPLTFSQLDTFLKSRIEVLEFVELPKLTANSDQASQRKNSGNAASFKSQPAASRISAHTASPQPVKSQVTCVYCKASHYIAACDGFRTLAADERKSYVKDNNLCFNCLGRHLLRDCRSTKTCRQCQGRHHTLLHIATTSPLSATLAQPESADPQPPAEKRTGVSAHTVYGSPHRSILLATARVIVISELQRSIEARALVDPCSEATFISESLAQRLRLQRQSMLVPVSGIGGARCSTAKSQASIIISPYFKTSTQWKLKALILPHLSDYIPPSYTLVKNLSFVADLQLADKDIDSNDKVDLIIGADLYPALIEEGLRKCDNAELIAQSTALGWILTGATPSQCSHTVVPQVITSHQISIDQDLHDLMERFWTQEEIVVKSKALTTEEEECEAHFASTHRRDPQGRYILRLPFKSSVDKLGDSASIARNTLIRMEKRFSHQPQLHKLYSDFMQEYIALDHMSETDAKKLDSSEQLFFLPHHGVLKVTADKSKLRVVFNGSIKTNSGVTLNDCLHIGPKLQNEIFDILLRWRTYRYVFSADIEKMFRQILIDERDRRYQQIFWRKNPKEDIKAYSLHTVTYGLASSPYQAIRVLHQLAADEKEKYPTAAQILLQNSYVDDILAGADSLEEAQNLRQELSSLLLAGGLPLSKWTSNHPSVLSSLSPAQVASSQQYSWPTEESYCMLGITWQPNEDCFKFSVKNIQIESIMTKRKALSFIGHLYDPLGWISPIIIQFKIFIQRLWPLGLTWDDPLPQNLHSHWQTLVTDLQQLSSLSVPRWFGASLHSNMQIEVHGFADASQAAYGAVVYLRLIGVSSSSRCIILASKTKVAPLKQVSLPRLELCAAHLLTRLVKHITNVISSPNIPIHLWSDSTIVLSWIHGHPTQWKTYVANRVSEIQTTLPSASWHHIAGTQNPADVASRGASVEAISSPSLWMDGPKLLATSREPWTREINIKIQEVDLESRTIVSHATSLVPEESAILLRYSQLNKLLRVTARCVEFGRRLRDKTSRASLKVQTRDSIDGINELTPAQIDSALKLWIAHVQQLHFSSEIRAISQNSPLSKRSGLVRLTPFIDEQGLLRVGGRLQHSLLHPDEKHPYILPHKSFLSLLLARDAHSKCLHGGTQLTLSHLRRRFWILRGRQLVKGVIFRCIRCWRYQSTPSTQLMSDLPQSRVQRCRPFLHTGIDYAGPIYLKCSKGRGTKSFKGYIAIFVCLPTRAIHLEVASGYSTEDFLLVYRRFVARRGICATLSSDCGTNFVGADKELRELFAQAKSQHSEIAHHLANEGTEWRFNPPSAPHFGGIWEAAVKSTKFHLRRVIGESRLTFEELSTLLAQIEACLNSRPLQPLTDDPTDLAALTPAHFLIGSSTCTIPEPSTLDLPTSRLSRAQLLRNMYEHFWSRWSAEYLQELQYRPKWQLKNQKIEVGQMCVIRSELAPPCKWSLARIIEVHPGKDGLVRVVRLQTATSTLTRPLSKISILPFVEDYSPIVGEGGRNVPK